MSDDDPEPLNTVRSHPTVTHIIDPGDDVIADWTIYVSSEIPGNLIIPGDILQAVRKSHSEILHIQQSKSTDDWVIAGRRVDRRLSGNAGIDRLRDTTHLQVDDLDDCAFSADYEAVVTDSPRQHGLMDIQRTRLRIKNIQNHEYRNGFSLHLIDPESDSGATLERLDEKLRDD